MTRTSSEGSRCPRTAGPGATPSADGSCINFALSSCGATGVSLVLFTPADLAAGRPSEEIVLDPRTHRTGATWHVALPALTPGLLYGYRVEGPLKVKR